MVVALKQNTFCPSADFSQSVTVFMLFPPQSNLLLWKRRVSRESEDVPPRLHPLPQEQVSDLRLEPGSCFKELEMRLKGRERGLWEVPTLSWTGEAV